MALKTLREAGYSDSEEPEIVAEINKIRKDRNLTDALDADRTSASIVLMPIAPLGNPVDVRPVVLTDKVKVVLNKKPRD